MLNNWNKLEYDEQVMIVDAANRLMGLYMIKDIVKTFNKINLPLLYSQPGFHERFSPDTDSWRRKE